MTWRFPAKTFFLGEYVALAHEPAIVLTSTPEFQISVTDEPSLQGIDPESPAGRYWLAEGPVTGGLQWHDPYHGIGGMGASSAQFLGAYAASQFLQKKPIMRDALLADFFRMAWNGEGVRPSGYDVLAQSVGGGCVYLDGRQQVVDIMGWPFHDLAFFLLHTGYKLPTHHHLRELLLPKDLDCLTRIVASGRHAFLQADSSLIIDAVNAYHRALEEKGWVASHSLSQMRRLQQQPDVLAVKGCGAMGSDILLLLVLREKVTVMTSYLFSEGWTILSANTMANTVIW